MPKAKLPLIKEIDIVYVKTSKLKPAPYNPRRISDDALERLSQGIEHFGTVDPLVVRKSDNVIIGGHQRFKALEQLGYKKAPVVYVDLDDAQSKALNILLNNTETQGTWDIENLNLLINEIKFEIPQIDITGFNEFNLPTDFKGIFDSLEAGAFVDSVNEKSDLFSITFLFPKEKKELISSNIKKNGKDYYTEQIIELLKGD